MAFNPSKQGEPLSTPTNGRKNSTNDPGYENKQGYYPYDLSHTEVFTPLYGQVHPSLHMITAPGDRHVVRDDNKLILNKIPGNFLNTVNQYVDTFFVSNRTMFPNNWDKLIPNPVKGDDLPHSARPVIPLYGYIANFLSDGSEFTISYIDSSDNPQSISASNYTAYSRLSSYEDNLNEHGIFTDYDALLFSYMLANLSFVSYIVSRGQLLDHLGVQFDLKNTRDYLTSFQHKIDTFYLAYWRFVENQKISMFNVELNPISDYFNFTDMYESSLHTISELSQFRDRYMTAFERGELLVPKLVHREFQSGDDVDNLFVAIADLVTAFDTIFVNPNNVPSIEDVDREDEFNRYGYYLNISKCLAYQLSIAQYYTNDSVDNIYTSDLYMQLLRGTMFPSINNMTSEPTFDYNGVPTEYDYISYGAWYTSLMSNSITGRVSRTFLVGSLLFVLRRSLRYGDYFTTGRTRLLAVGQLSVPVNQDDGMSVNPIDITMGIVSQRYLNAANRVGNKPIAYYASIMGVTPSDMPSIPRYVSHRKIELENRVSTNLANDQGEQVTNLVGYSDNMAFDVFIDDYGILLSLNSFDILPIYNSGIDADNFLSDRFEYFNPMMQNIGDQPIRLSELISGSDNYRKTFAYTVRNSEYKFKNSKAHGAICYNMPGYLLKFPVYRFDDLYGYRPIDHIDPDFIRDKPAILDQIMYETPGASPGDYYHFIVSVHNEVKSARLIQKAPGILF